ncbi:MAG: hypothetical protein R3C03_20875 [Pirellulaceae bacterium]
MAGVLCPHRTGKSTQCPICGNALIHEPVEPSERGPRSDAERILNESLDLADNLKRSPPAPKPVPQVNRMKRTE